MLAEGWPRVAPAEYRRAHKLGDITAGEAALVLLRLGLDLGSFGLRCCFWQAESEAEVGGLRCTGGAAGAAGQRRGRGPEEAEAPFLVELREGGSATFEDFYELGEKLGEGSFGKVYACQEVVRGSSRVTGRRAADGEQRLCAKAIAPPRSGKLSDAVDKEFLHCLKELRHPSIVRHRRVLQTADTLYVVMDRCDGPELLDHVKARGGFLACKEVRGLARQLLGALAAVHEAGLMHRDVKPQNLRFSCAAATTLQLLDFGSAKASGSEPAKQSVTGTFVYAAPEVFDGFYGSQCDLWSAGVVLFLLVSGHLPFDTADVKILRSMHNDPVLTGDSLIRGEHWRKAPAGAKSLVRGLLAVDPAVRLTAAGAVQHSWLAGEEDRNDHLGEVATTEGLMGSSGRPPALVGLKRSDFVWDLAACGDGGELEGVSPTRWRTGSCSPTRWRRPHVARGGVSKLEAW